MPGSAEAAGRLRGTPGVPAVPNDDRSDDRSTEDHVSETTKVVLALFRHSWSLTAKQIKDASKPIPRLWTCEYDPRSTRGPLIGGSGQGHACFFRSGCTLAPFRDTSN